MNRVALLILALVTAGFATGCGMMRGVLAYHGWDADRVEVETLDAALRSHDEWFLPGGEGPLPGLLLMPGCLGTQPFHRSWARDFAEVLREQGAPLEVIVLDADHWFDNPEGFDLVAHRHDPLATKRARDRILALLRDRLRPKLQGDLR
jgi:dienelactone hydrolase